MNTEGYETHRNPGQPIAVDKWCNRLGAFVFDVPHMFALRIIFWGERGDPLDATWPDWFRRGYDAGKVTTPCGKEQALAAFEIAWAALMWATDDHPESIPEWYEMGRYKEGTDSGERKGIRGAALTPVQAGIREKLRRVWLARYVTGKS